MEHWIITILNILVAIWATYEFFYNDNKEGKVH
jgi:CDP-diglyceride synthetase